MKYEKNRKILGIDEYKLMKIGKILIIPAIILILLIVIVLTNKGRNKTDEEVAPAQETQTTRAQSAVVADTGAAIEGPAENHKETENNADTTAAAEQAEERYHNDFGSYGLQKDAVPEVRELVAKYQRAKVTGDADLMYEVFGRNDNDGREDMQNKLSEEKSAYEAYDNTVCYTTPGVEPDSYIVFISSNIKFSGIDTSAPMLTWAYVIKGSDGKYYMKEPDKLTAEEEDAVNQVSASEDVALLDKEMKKNLAQAVVSDPHLAALYQTWSEGYVPVETEGWTVPHMDTSEEGTEESFEEVEVKIGE